MQETTQETFQWNTITNGKWALVKLLSTVTPETLLNKHRVQEKD